MKWHLTSARELRQVGQKPLASFLFFFFLEIWLDDNGILFKFKETLLLSKSRFKFFKRPLLLKRDEVEILKWHPTVIYNPWFRIDGLQWLKTHPQTSLRNLTYKRRRSIYLKCYFLVSYQKTWKRMPLVFLIKVHTFWSLFFPSLYKRTFFSTENLIRESGFVYDDNKQLWSTISVYTVEEFFNKPTKTKLRLYECLLLFISCCLDKFPIILNEYTWLSFIVLCRTSSSSQTLD